ncbi:CDGSH iron sulfur domain-containing protein [Pelagophyceae sp. CCMP2097]|nr:CDGSH iron sulfur domain-containing protein [Pelagophyceae sp. CCMP2097]|mmetsp:Transcript_15773/g.53137  ORF Transcript_15773/g.53137 Transcript_15773/m.53137 type:complete len:102 (-) Transcript_15773:540-845(-)|eukprot:CAMPEP_0184086098 /NCGR_PEP_ID=MMETSP0974-20121125/5040_1 /TAXON_ID=483370 /ORGANISM="non described non described, Strain CCMP2097" /LENGTH=101 /DNA_ID=CAMNT_0026388781 /DNA_START=21 /DNA_END=326 /DNA_ORIENTATION=+
MTMMKTIFALFTLAARSTAFTASRQPAARTVATRAEKINTMVDLTAPKVVTMEKLEAGSKKVYCRCWQSGTFPLCDGSHAKHNEATGDNVGPLIVSVPKAE